jgi:hypothetical protein
MIEKVLALHEKDVAMVDLMLQTRRSTAQVVATE